jgi:hypothetical protein
MISFSHCPREYGCKEGAASATRRSLPRQTVTNTCALSHNCHTRHNNNLSPTVSDVVRRLRARYAVWRATCSSRRIEASNSLATATECDIRLLAYPEPIHKGPLCIEPLTQKQLFPFASEQRNSVWNTFFSTRTHWATGTPMKHQICFRRTTSKAGPSCYCNVHDWFPRPPFKIVCHGLRGQGGCKIGLEIRKVQLGISAVRWSLINFILSNADSKNEYSFYMGKLHLFCSYKKQKLASPDVNIQRWKEMPTKTRTLMNSNALWYVLHGFRTKHYSIYKKNYVCVTNV